MWPNGMTTIAFATSSGFASGVQLTFSPHQQQCNRLARGHSFHRASPSLRDRQFVSDAKACQTRDEVHSSGLGASSIASSGRTVATRSA